MDDLRFSFLFQKFLESHSANPNLDLFNVSDDAYFLPLSRDFENVPVFALDFESSREVWVKRSLVFLEL